MNILSLPKQTPLLQHEALERGLPATTLDEIAQMLDLPKKRIIAALRFAERTIQQREKSHTRFTLEESERILRILRIRETVREIFTTDKAVSQWMQTPDANLGGKAPLDLLATDMGTFQVQNLALAMVHGVPI